MGKDSSLQMTKLPWTEAQRESIQDPKEGGNHLMFNCQLDII